MNWNSGVGENCGFHDKYLFAQSVNNESQHNKSSKRQNKHFLKNKSHVIIWLCYTNIVFVLYFCTQTLPRLILHYTYPMIKSVIQMWFQGDNK